VGRSSQRTLTQSSFEVVDKVLIVYTEVPSGLK
jgi:hypothetical protein